MPKQTMAVENPHVLFDMLKVVTANASVIAIVLEQLEVYRVAQHIFKEVCN